MEANKVIDSLLRGQFNINSVLTEPDITDYKFSRSYFLDKTVSIFKSQMYLRGVYKKIDP